MGIVIDSNGVINIAASTPGTYRITYTTAGTCPSSSFQDITINALPTISIAGGNFCSGSTSTLTATASSGTAFVWELDTGSGFNVISGQTNSTISVSTVGEYRAKVTDTNGCTSAYSNTLSIAQFASPSVTITTVPGTTICTGDTATLTANASGGTGSFTYSWNTSPVQTTPAIDVTASGTYTVTVTDGNGCTATASQAITASTNATAIASIDNDNAMSFNGTDQYIVAGNDTSLQITGALTLSTWFKSSYSGSNNQRIISKDDNVNRCYMTQLDGSGNANFYIWNGNSGKAAVSTGTDYRDGDWHHIVGVFNPNASAAQRLAIYIDGVNVGYGNTSVTTIDNDTVDLEIGRKQDNTLFFNGSLDEAAVFNTALSSCDVKGIYEGSIGSNAGKAANLLDANTTIPAPIYWNRMGDS